MHWSAKRMHVLLACPLVAVSAWAGPDGLPVVSQAQQAQRDATRLHILRTELAAEEQGLARASERRAERTAAQDAQGAAEAEQALVEHRRNVQALRAEIEQAGQTGQREALPLNQAGARGTSAPKQRQRHTAGAAGNRAERPWWDAYSNPLRSQQRQAGSPNGHDGTPSGPRSAWWSAYPGGPNP